MTKQRKNKTQISSEKKFVTCVMKFLHVLIHGILLYFHCRQITEKKKTSL